MEHTNESTAMFASIARQWESRPECLERVTEQVRAIHDKLIEWGWKTVRRDFLDYATRKYSLACQVHECCEWLPFDVIPSWEDDLYCLLMEEEEDRWLDCINENRPVWELAATIRREWNKTEFTLHDSTGREPDEIVTGKERADLRAMTLTLWHPNSRFTIIPNVPS